MTPQEQERLLRVSAHQIFFFSALSMGFLLAGLLLSPSDGRYADYAWAAFGICAAIVTKSGLQNLAALGGGGIRQALAGIVSGTPAAPTPQPKAPTPHPKEPTPPPESPVKGAGGPRKESRK